jgi:hypothetical protein
LTITQVVSHGIAYRLFARHDPDGGRIVFECAPAWLVAARSTLTGEHLAAYAGR